MKNKPKLLLFDGNAIVHRSFHALPESMKTKAGEPVNAVYGFAAFLLKAVKEFKPTYVAVTFDLAGPTFRHKKFEAYKATRVKADQELYDQIPLCHEVARVFNFPIYEKAGYEADDAIGTIVHSARGGSAFGGKVQSQKSQSGDDETGTNLGEVVDALVGLGYSKEEARETVKSLNGEGKTSEELLKQAFKILSR